MRTLVIMLKYEESGDLVLPPCTINEDGRPSFLDVRSDGERRPE